VDETGGTGQERQVGWSIGCGGGGLRNSGRASGGAEGTQELRAPALIEDIFGDGFGFGGIELGSLIKVVGAGFRGGLFSFPTVEIHVELGQRGPPGWTDQWEDLIDPGQKSRPPGGPGT